MSDGNHHPEAADGRREAPPMFLTRPPSSYSHNDDFIPEEISEYDCSTTVSSMPSLLPLPNGSLYPTVSSVDVSLPSTNTMMQNVHAPNNASGGATTIHTTQPSRWQGRGLDSEEQEMLKLIEARSRRPATSSSAPTPTPTPTRPAEVVDSAAKNHKQVKSVGGEPRIDKGGEKMSAALPTNHKTLDKKGIPGRKENNKKKTVDHVGVGVEATDPHDHNAAVVLEGVPGAYAVAPSGTSTVSNEEEAAPPAPQPDETGGAEPHDEEAPQALDAVLVADVSLRQQQQNQQSTTSLDTNTNHEGTHSNNQQQPLRLAIEEATPIEGETTHKTLCPKENLWALFAIFIMIVAVIFLVLGILGVFRNDDAGGTESVGPHAVSNNSTISTIPTIDPFSSPTLKRIQQEGLLRCVYQEPFDLFWTGLDNALCQAVAAAAQVEVKYVSTLWINTLADLRDGRVDILANLVAQSMDRQVHALRADVGFAFTVPYLYGGMKVLGDPFFVKCAEEDFKHIDECKDLAVCVPHNAIQEVKIERMVSPRNIVKIAGLLNLLQSVKNITALLESQACNVIAMEGTYLSDAFVQLQGYIGNFTTSKRVFSKDVAAIATRSNDPIFSDFVNTVVQGVLAGASHNITKANANTTAPQTHLFGEQYKGMLRDAVSANGNFDEIFARTMGPFLPASELKGYHNGSPAESVHSIPFGFVNHKRNLTTAPLGPGLQEILDRGQLHCGVVLDRPGFATKLVAPLQGHAGMEIDLCRGLAASLFQGDYSAVVFIEMTDSSHGYPLLADGSVDVIAGATWNLENDVKEPTTGLGFAFSRPYFYFEDRLRGQEEDNNLSLSTRQEDHDWQSFVSWFVMCLQYAEEQGIDRLSSNKMPLVSVFGPSLERMMRDAVLTVGSYAELYERNLETYIPRSGRNAANSTVGATNAQPFVVPGLY